MTIKEIREPDIKAVAEYLNNDTTLQNLLPGWLYISTPKEIPEWPYLTLSIREEYQFNYTISPSIRFRAIGHDNTVDLGTLRDIRSRVVNLLCKGAKFSHRYGFRQSSNASTRRLDNNAPMYEFWIRGNLVRGEY